ncbi:MAG: HAD-IA family hydrolase [Gammaproteobacteria bacterium]|nr:HAD-IA family hydrolase [Gammaproteobacteria bacterium]
MSIRCYKTLSDITAIGFDLDDTLYDNAPVLHRAEQKLREHLAKYFPKTIGMTFQHWFEIRQLVVAKQPALANDVSLTRVKTLTRGLINLGYAQSAATDGAHTAMELFLTWRNTIDIPVETHQTLAKLATKFRLFAISNGNASTTSLNLDQYFEFALHPSINIPMKPAGDLFTLAQHQLALPSDQILYVGDHPIADIIGATNANWQSCWFNPSKSRLNHRRNSLLLPTIEISQLGDLAQLC